jgi:hypothetical protein
MTPIFALCDDYVVKWAALDPVGAGMRGIVGDFGTATDYSPDGHAARAALIRTRRGDPCARLHLRAAYYTPPSEDLTRPGRTWWPLGERAWLAARDEARRRPGFDLKRWHTAALDLGPIGLDGLAESPRRID